MKAALVGFLVMLTLGATGSAAARLALLQPEAPPAPPPLTAPLDANRQLSSVPPSGPDLKVER